MMTFERIKKPCCEICNAATAIVRVVATEALEDKEGSIIEQGDEIKCLL